MRKDSSNSSGGPGRDSSFRKEEGRKPFSKDSKPFKKNYDGRQSTAGSEGEGRPSRPGKPYSGRITDSDKPKRSFGNDYRKSGGDRPFSDRPKRSFDKDDRKSGSDRPAFNKEDRKPGYKSGDSKFRTPKEHSEGKEGENSRPFSDRPKRAFDKPAYDKKTTGGKFDKDSKPRKDGDKKTGDSRPFRERLNHVFDREKKVLPEREIREDAVIKDLGDVESDFKDKMKTPFKKKYTTTASGKKRHYHNHDHDDDEDLDEDDKDINQTNGPRLEMPLNKYIAHSGECSRRDAAELVKQGKVKVNGELVTDPGHRIKHDDQVTMSGKKLTPQKGMVYILLNKPKGFITTNEDPQGRKTVMDLVGSSGVDRLFPVGRLDKETSGLLLITNDGDLTQKLCHPAYNVKKVYQVTLDKPLTKADFEKIAEGVELEDGKATVDAIAYLEKKNEIGLEIHSGKNRIVRRIFESAGYVVEKLDRVMYAGLTKKNLPRSKWRYLDEREIVLLKHFKI